MPQNNELPRKMNKYPDYVYNDKKMLESMLVIEKEMNFFKQNINTIRELYGEDYIAVSNQQIIGTNTNEFELYTEVHKKYPHKVILITNINDYNRVFRIDTPEIKSKPF